MTKFTGKPMRVPIEFDNWVKQLQKQFMDDTGEYKSKSQILRKMGNKLNGKILVHKNEFDWKIF